MNDASRPPGGASSNSEGSLADHLVSDVSAPPEKTTCSRVHVLVEERTLYRSAEDERVLDVLQAQVAGSCAVLPVRYSLKRRAMLPYRGLSSSESPFDRHPRTPFQTTVSRILLVRAGWVLGKFADSRPARRGPGCCAGVPTTETADAPPLPHDQRQVRESLLAVFSACSSVAVLAPIPAERYALTRRQRTALRPRRWCRARPSRFRKCTRMRSCS